MIASCVFLLLSSGIAFEFDLPVNTERCFEEFYSRGTEFSVAYEAAPGNGQTVTFKVQGDVPSVFESTDDRNHISYLVESDGAYAFCFTNTLQPGYEAEAKVLKRRITFSHHSAQDGDTEEGVESLQLKPIEKNLRRVESMVRVVHGEYEHLKDMERHMRSENDHMLNRSIILALVVMSSVVSLSLFHVRHLKMFFKRKRMID